MQIRDLFEKDINRSINGVIKVSQDDEESIRQELSEYVVTRELSRHFSDFFESYERAIDVPTDKIGVWISGFFGSGKSHFLKMLSYLLSNRKVAGKNAIDYFDNKVEDEMVFNKMKRACSIPTEAILFNIDEKASNWKEGEKARTALLRAFMRVFYEHLGFFGEDLNLARLEAFIDEQGKTQQFREAFARVNGGDWVTEREDWTFHEDDIVEVLQEVLGWSEQQARRQFDRDDDEAMAPEDLVREISQYVDKRTNEEGGKFRLLFMVDEVGQFIGADVNLMLNLQTLVEKLGSTCHGQVWVMVTSQEAIDEVTKVAGNDFSKIQGRFNTRLSLSSSSVEEVIKRRVLQKKADAAASLEAIYEKNAAPLKNLFTFEGARSDYFGYKTAQDFQETYPFVGYQFNLVRDILREIRVHGNSGKHLSGGERSMLSGFQESTQAIEAQETGALVPLWRFYDTLAEFLEHDIRQVIDRCAKAAEDQAGIQPQDVEVLKTLYLIRYINDIKPTVGNITIFMADAIDIDTIALRTQVADSLTRLVGQNYVGRSGDSYHFLTNVEQDIAREIKDVDVDSAAVVASISRIIFDNLFTMRKLHVGVNDFPIDASVDGVLHGTAQGGMKLEVITQANMLSNASDGELNLQSSGRALVVLADSGNYYEGLQNAAKIEKFAKTRNMQQLDIARQRIIQDKQREAKALREEAARFIAESIVNARVSIDGTMEEVRAPKADKKLEMVLERLASVVYKKANYVDAPINDKGELIRILKGANQRALAGTGGGNQQAISAVETFLEVQHASNMPTSFGDIKREFQKEPYGWREIDIAGCVVQLIADKKVEVSRAGMPLDMQDSKLADYLTNKNEAEGMKVSIREHVDELLLKQVRKILHDLPNMANLPTDEDGLVGVAKEWLENVKTHCGDLLAKEYMQGKDYPGKQAVTKGRTLAEQLLEQSRSAKAFLEAIVSKKTELLDFGEDYERVLGFFPNQRRIFDEALDACELVDTDSMYLKDNAEIQDALASIRGVISDQHPWNDLMKLGGYVRAIKTQHASALASQKRELLDALTGVEGDIREFANGKHESETVLSVLSARITPYRNQINGATTLIKLYAIKEQLYAFGDDQKALIDQIDEEANTAKSVVSPVIHTTDASGQPMTKRIDLGSDTTQQPAPTIKKLDRRSVFDYGKLTSPDEVDTYVEKVRQKLLTELDDVDAIVISNG